MRKDDAAHQAETSQRVRLGRSEVHLDTHEVFLDGQPSPVSHRVFALIAYLLQERPRIVCHKEILEIAWRNPQASHNAIARAVMQARKALGDDVEPPGLIISVHGVGYRLAERTDPTADHPSANDSPAKDGAGNPLRTVLGMVDACLRLMQGGELGRAGELAKEALHLADTANSNSARCHALSVSASLALRRGSAIESVRLASQALRIARLEDSPHLVATARMAVGAAHLFGGDLTSAITHLQEARETLARSDDVTTLFRCTSLLSLALRNNGQVEAALKMCQVNIELGLRGGLDPALLMVDRMNEPLLMVMLGDAARDRGSAADSSCIYARALQQVDLVFQALAEHGPASMVGACQSNRSLILERLGRIEEAWTALQACDAEQHVLNERGSALAADRQQTLHMHRAKLLQREGRLEEALLEVGFAIDAAVKTGQRNWLPVLYGLGSEIAEAKGNLALALQWSRDRFVAQATIHKDASASLAAMLAAELDVQALQKHADELQNQVDQLLRENHTLRQQASKGEPRSPRNLRKGSGR